MIANCRRVHIIVGRLVDTQKGTRILGRLNKGRNFGESGFIWQSWQQRRIDKWMLMLVAMKGVVVEMAGDGTAAVQVQFVVQMLNQCGGGELPFNSVLKDSLISLCF